ncbi:lysozyme inhibitor LprI family protein [Methyloglobulus sp.]|uniref:lysozyme inhibitor LprI family protein n=1 Tax=Methyloglobulus sp. TaxID=2518622 RepID=UPI003989D421
MGFCIRSKKRCSVSNQIENNDCINHEYKVSDTELNRLYKLLINDLVNPEPLKKSQLAWITFRDLSCKYELSGLTSEGSLNAYGRLACLIDLTEKRILDLKVYSTWTYDGSPPRKH